MITDVAHGRLIDSSDVLRLTGSVDSHEQMLSINGTLGDVLFCKDTGISYVYVNYGWEPIACVNDVIPVSAKVISHCPNCGGRLSKILPESRVTGHQVCEWCMSTINIYC